MYHGYPARPKIYDPIDKIDISFSFHFTINRLRLAITTRSLWYRSLIIIIIIVMINYDSISFWNPVNLRAVKSDWNFRSVHGRCLKLGKDRWKAKQLICGKHDWPYVFFVILIPRVFFVKRLDIKQNLTVTWYSIV